MGELLVVPGDLPMLSLQLFKSRVSGSLEQRGFHLAWTLVGGGISRLAGRLHGLSATAGRILFSVLAAPSLPAWPPPEAQAARPKTGNEEDPQNLVLQAPRNAHCSTLMNATHIVNGIDSTERACKITHVPPH